MATPRDIGVDVIAPELIGMAVKTVHSMAVCVLEDRLSKELFPVLE